MNKCSWLYRNKLETCGRPCRGEYFCQHNYTVKKEEHFYLAKSVGKDQRKITAADAEQSESSLSLENELFAERTAKSVTALDTQR